MKFRMDPVASAEFVKQVPYPGFVPGMIELLDPAFAATLPTSPANAAVQFDSTAPGGRKISMPSKLAGTNGC